MFLPNNTGKLTRQKATDLYGQPSWSSPVRVPCGVVHLNRTSQKTSVRTDSSASRGNADEFVSQAKILFRSNVRIAVGDRFEIGGMTLRATAIEPRYSVAGIYDHNEVDFELWVA